ncbi:MAG: dTDP-4-dehydrorhamnose reductase [Balneolaceae bacterium]|nr:dTDP-4-dehydrorhamnose reductase [Balneolaceae bacterium]
MKYLVTGAGGQLGREWVDFLKNQKVPFSDFSSVDLDITDLQQVKTVMSREKPDILINCAAYTRVDDAEANREKAFLVNETGVKILTDSCMEIGAKLVHYSTDYVFPGHQNDRNTYPDGYSENGPIGPVNVYGESKRAGERVLEKSAADWLLVRVSWLCGRYGKNFVKTMIKLSAERDQLNVVDDQIGSPTYTFDVVEKTWFLLQKEVSGTFHLASKGAVTWAGFAEEIFRQRGVDIRMNRVSSDEFKTAAKRPSFSLLSTRKAEEYGLQMIEWKSGLGRLLRQIG